MKAPLGLLIQGSFRHTTGKLRELLAAKKPKKLIAVGDRVSGNIVESGIHLDVAIVDNKVMRKPISPVRLEAQRAFRLSNPPGTLTDEAWQIIREAIEFGGRVKVLVEGEEDLLTLVAVLSAPVGSVVVYGQPRRGIVVIDVTETTQRRFREIVERMEHGLSKD